MSQSHLPVPTTPRFIHLRWHNDNGVMYVNVGITIGYYIKDDGKIVLAFSMCHWKDNYCKRIGRQIVTGRLESGDCYTIDLPDEPTEIYDKVKNFVLGHIRTVKGKMYGDW